jgi:hypothetical protein
MPKTHTVSWSEIDTFRQCPFKHELAYKQRWSKTPEEGGPLSRGTLLHEVMEAHYLAMKLNQDAKGTMPTVTESRVAEQMDTIDVLLGRRGGVRTMQTEQQNLVEWMYEGYLAAFGYDQLEWEIVAVEYANEFWLPTVNGGRSNYKIKMKLDLIMRQRTTGQLWIWDHKSCKNLPTDKMLELNDQFGLYIWGLRQLGMEVRGAIHNACRTQRNKGPMELAERFLRTPLYRTDEELNTIAVEAYKTARRAWGATKEGEAERNTNEDTCRWRCDFTETCLGSRKDRDPRGYLQHSLTLSGFTQNRERH